MGAGASTPSSTPTDPAACPVDHKTREAWLQQHRASGDAPHPPSSSTNSSDPEGKPRTKSHRALSTDREVSNIPRAVDPSSNQPSAYSSAPPSPYATNANAASHGFPSNSEYETGHDKDTGNWIYPSERQFFEALMRKGNTPSSTNSASDLATTVASIIPIHNAVNERAWKEVLAWESQAPTSDPGSRRCGGPKLYSFRGLGVEDAFLSPRARMNGLLGYQRPFDRHDWVVERCDGERVEYVIDFYQGKSSGGSSGAAGLSANAMPGKLNFYLDVRPKLNSWEGWRMRFSRATGL